ncbi:MULTISPECIES: type IV pilus twitching motility protein PilT [unclassified Nocardioides]|uniref:type IV pilus twitching motility protein PilT n=1 Tax=unclassified Nocardioides TaxID=2615069 RepID=UPI0036100DD8
MTDQAHSGFGLPLAGARRAEPAPAAAPVTTAPPLAVAPVAPVAATERPLVLDDLLGQVLDLGASDLHLTVGVPPSVRRLGEMEPLPGYAPLGAEQLRSTLYGVLTERQRKTFEEELEFDLAYAVPGRARFRVNLFRQREAVGAVLRTIPWKIVPLEDLGMPDVVSSFAALKRGLVLVTGPTGSGKSTTLAAVIDQINRSRRGHIVTIEDPIEFLHEHRGCVVNQREIGSDTHDFRAALKHVLRQDPDVILVGELRDLDTISVALTAAETGHLVLATLHTQSAQDTVSRVVDVFPADQQQQVRTQLAATLQGVVCQTLVPTVDGAGRVAAVEVMVCNPGIRAMIRDDKLQQIQGSLQAGAKDGMQTLNAHLAALVRAGRITFAAGLEHCSNRDDFETLVGPAVTRSPSSWE